MNPKHFTREYTHTPSEKAKSLPFYIHRIGWKAQQPAFTNRRKANAFYDFQLQYIIDGTCYLEWKGGQYTLGPGEVFFLDLAKEHSYSASSEDPCEVIWIHFGGTHAASYYAMLEAAGPVFHCGDPGRMGQLFREAFHLVTERPVGQDLLISSLITTILTEMAVYAMQGSTAHPNIQSIYTDKINKAIAYIEKEYRSPLTLRDIAKTAMLSPYHFSRVFKRITGFTVKEYLIKYRLTQAKYLLSSTDLPQNEIAERVGFTDQSYLGRIFRKYEKTTPLKYRQHAADRL